MTAFAAFVYAFIFVVYFFPTFQAMYIRMYSKGTYVSRQRVFGVFATNLLVGWTVVGWIIAVFVLVSGMHETGVTDKNENSPRMFEI